MNLEVFTDFLRCMSKKLNTESEKIKFSNDILGIVQETLHIRQLNNSFRVNKSSFDVKKHEQTDECASLFEVESFIDNLISDDKSKHFIDYKSLDAKKLRKIRLYLEENKNLIEKKKLEKAAAKIKELLLSGRAKNIMF